MFWQLRCLIIFVDQFSLLSSTDVQFNLKCDICINWSKLLDSISDITVVLQPFISPELVFNFIQRGLFVSESSALHSWLHIKELIICVGSVLYWCSAPHRVNCQTVATVSSLAAVVVFALLLPSCRRRHCLPFYLLHLWAASFINLQYSHVKSMFVLPMQTCYQKNLCVCMYVCVFGFAKGLNCSAST